VWADTFKIGCGASKCSSVVVRGKTWIDATLLVCNYGPGGNFRNQYVTFNRKFYLSFTTRSDRFLNV